MLPLGTEQFKGTLSPSCPRANLPVAIVPGLNSLGPKLRITSPNRVSPEATTLLGRIKLSMKTLLERLIQSLEHPLQNMGKLMNENKSLRHQQESLVSERSHLIEKNELARSKVEAMIDRLQALEQES